VRISSRPESAFGTRTPIGIMASLSQYPHRHCWQRRLDFAAAGTALPACSDWQVQQAACALQAGCHPALRLALPSGPNPAQRTLNEPLSVFEGFGSLLTQPQCHGPPGGWDAAGGPGPGPLSQGFCQCHWWLTQLER